MNISFTFEFSIRYYEKEIIKEFNTDVFFFIIYYQIMISQSFNFLRWNKVCFITDVRYIIIYLLRHILVTFNKMLYIFFASYVDCKYKLRITLQQNEIVEHTFDKLPLEYFLLFNIKI